MPTKAWNGPSTRISKPCAKRSKMTRHGTVISRPCTGLDIACVRSAHPSDEPSLEPPLGTANCCFYRGHTTLDIRGGGAGELDRYWGVSDLRDPPRVFIGRRTGEQSVL